MYVNYIFFGEMDRVRISSPIIFYKHILDDILIYNVHYNYLTFMENKCKYLTVHAPKPDMFIPKTSRKENRDHVPSTKSSRTSKSK